jgi:hypothetical protein
LQIFSGNNHGNKVVILVFVTVKESGASTLKYIIMDTTGASTLANLIIILMEVNLSLDHHIVPTNLLEMLYAPVDVVLKQLKEISAAQSQLKEIYSILLLFCLLY